MSHKADLPRVIVITRSSVSTFHASTSLWKSDLSWRNEDEEWPDIVCDMLSLLLAYVIALACLFVTSLAIVNNQPEWAHSQMMQHGLHMLYYLEKKENKGMRQKTLTSLMFQMWRRINFDLMYAAPKADLLHLFAHFTFSAVISLYSTSRLRRKMIFSNENN